MKEEFIQKSFGEKPLIVVKNRFQRRNLEHSIGLELKLDEAKSSEVDRKSQYDSEC